MMNKRTPSLILALCVYLSAGLAHSQMTAVSDNSCGNAAIESAKEAERHGRCLLAVISQICAGSGEYGFQSKLEGGKWKVISTPVNAKCPAHTVFFNKADGGLLSMETNVKNR